MVTTSDIAVQPFIINTLGLQAVTPFGTNNIHVAVYTKLFMGILMPMPLGLSFLEEKIKNPILLLIKFL